MIKIEHLQKIFRTEEVETRALYDISLHVKEGEFVAVMGPSGCGKSTLLNILGLLENPTSGTYLLNGTDFSRFIPGNYVLSDESVTLVETKKNGTNVEITYTGADGEIWIEVPLLWYPGYRAVDQDGKELPLERGEGSYLRVYTQGRPEATIYISYEGKTIYRVGDVISLGTLVVMAGWTVLGKKKVLRR